MAAYLIGYDIHPSEGQTYTSLTTAIKNLGRWWHHLDSTWVVVTELDEVKIRDELWQHMYADDELLVLKSSGIAAWEGFNDKGSAWLQANL